ncbi:hypothetical protein [Laribacter hongkongensis]|uniref:hypothetical protein n=1 Tax=Laribacter hongkongensis TaxID=168471 RepID=UPI001EFCDEF2|nr:hypothetical protein [Laribacter hongkongensis]MCG8999942.1 hypothetical protein [Laribacter hongkongensis]MCG9028487.1 hypothetical protein [Laribacter hongkongensis]MCG9034645.1 hypothetical protein [Laribacter hongkongensis]
MKLLLKIVTDKGCRRSGKGKNRGDNDPTPGAKPAFNGAQAAIMTSSVGVDVRVHYLSGILIQVSKCTYLQKIKVIVLTNGSAR